MTYRQCFDRLGNPVARPARSPVGHRVLQWVGLVCTLIGLALLYVPRAAT